MKRKVDFVTNSSSCSYILGVTIKQVCKKYKPDCIVFAICTQPCKGAIKYARDHGEEIGL